MPENTYASFRPDEQDVFFEDDIASDTDTSSGSETSAVDPGPDPSRTAQELFWAYRQAKAQVEKVHEQRYFALFADILRDFREEKVGVRVKDHLSNMLTW